VSACALVACSACSGGGEAGTGGTAGAGGQGGSPPDGLVVAHVARYDYVFDVGARSADVRLSLDVAAPGGDCAALESEHTPSVASWAGDPTLSTVVQDGVWTACGAPVGPGALELGATTTFPKKRYYNLDVGFSEKPDLAGGTFAYLLSWVGGCDLFAPCDDDPGTLADFRFEVRHAPGDVVMCPGTRTPGDTVTVCELDQAPTYSAVGFAVDPLWEESLFLETEGVSWLFYEVPGGGLANALDPSMMGSFFEWLTGLLGPYPYGSELRFAGGPTAWLGFEHPASVVLNEDLHVLSTDYADTAAHVTMHEVVHQWAGDRVTIASAADFVWKEAIAEYLPYVFEDEVLGADVAAASRAYWDAVSLQAEHHPRPTDDPTPPVHTFYGDVYGPGPMVLFVQLEALVGRPAVLAGLQAFLAEPGVRSVSELEAALEAASGKDLGAYFDAWVFGEGAPEWPTLDVQAAQVGNEVTVTVTQENASGALYGCVVEVEVAGATQSATALVDFGVAPTQASASATVTLGEPVVSTKLDPRHKLVGRESALPLVTPPRREVWRF
jgi:aminopeptidase N